MANHFMLFVVSFGILIMPDCNQAVADPPYHGTIFEFKNLMRETDPTCYQSIKFVKTTEQTMFDRRLDRFEKVPVYRFSASYSDLPDLEIDVNQEFKSQAAARTHAEFYADVFGRLPMGLRRNITALHIQAGKELFGGGQHLLIHTEQGQEYLKQEILEETLAHEAAHALDAQYARDPQLLAAQKQDGNFISRYAQEHPFREDIAESIVPFLAVAFRPERITDAQRNVIEQTIPARIRFFAGWNWDGFPKSETQKQNTK